MKDCVYTVHGIELININRKTKVIWDQDLSWPAVGRNKPVVLVLFDASTYFFIPYLTAVVTKSLKYIL